MEEMTSLSVFRRWKELGKGWYSAVIDYGCASSRILWIKFRFLNIKDCMGYIPNEGDGEERNRFWNDLDRTVDRIGNRYRLFSLGD